MEKIENRGRGLLTDRKNDLIATLHGVKSGEVRLTHYMRGQLEKGGYIDVKHAPKASKGTGRGRVVISLTSKGDALARKYKVQRTVQA